MPISAIDGCPESHWKDIYEILSDSIDSAGFTANLVSKSDDVGIIQKRIVQNLYDNPIVVCDVSGKNPNVMFELGLRLAFDKPTIIIKDDITSYSFDTSPIEHIEYPRDLRFSKIIDFKKKLSEKISATSHKSENDSNYTTFLKHFGEFTVPKIEKTEVPSQEYIIEQLKSMRLLIEDLQQSMLRKSSEAALNEFLRSSPESNIQSIGSSAYRFAKADAEMRTQLIERLRKSGTLLGNADPKSRQMASTIPRNSSDESEHKNS